MEKEEVEKIKKAVKEFFNKMNLDFEVEVSSPEDNTIPVDLEVDDPQVLIGKEGRTLAQIQRLLKIILQKEIEGQFYIDLDINNYKEKKTEYLKELARDTADEVALTREEKKLPAMPSYERRIIHLELADRKDVTTQSIGKEPKRRVIIKPYP